MALQAGAKLGPYEILNLLGKGGMGEVYKARDTRLERIVAIKVLPAHLAARPDVRERVEDLEDARELDAAIRRNADKPLIPWDEAKNALGL